jgi:hypothetical protein
MPNALSDRVALRYAKEVNWGVTPAVAGKGLLVLSDSLDPDYQTEESESVRGDGQVPNIVRVGQGSQGGIPFEMQYGQWDDLIEGAMRSAWEADEIENENDLVSFTVEKQFQDLTSPNVFAAYKGLRVGGLTLNFAPKSRLTGEISFMGKAPEWASTSAFTGPAEEALDNPMMVTSAGLEISVGGAPFPIATEFSLSVDNELRMQDALGAIDPIGIGLGLFRASGTLAGYFPDRNLVDRIVGDQFFALAVEIEDGDGNEYLVEIPSAKLMTQSGVGNAGRSSDVIQSYTWNARRDPSTGYTMKITRTDAP